MNTAQLSTAIMIALMTGNVAMAQGVGTPAAAAPPAQTAPPGTRPAPPARDPNTPGYVTAKELPDGSVPPSDVDGNFIIGPTHNPAPEMTPKEGVPQGALHNLTMSSADSTFYPGIAREPGT